MLVVDASCLCEVLTGSPGAEAVRRRLAADADHAAPHIVDVEVFGVIRQELMLGKLDQTAAELAIDDMRSWPGERFGHRSSCLARGSCVTPYGVGMPFTWLSPRRSMQRWSPEIAGWRLRPGPRVGSRRLAASTANARLRS
jgi:hypothetical protein